MKKVVFVSENRVLIECLTSLVNSNYVIYDEQLKQLFIKLAEYRDI